MRSCNLCDENKKRKVAVTLAVPLLIIAFTYPAAISGGI
jgi:hypothetical protein